LKGVAVVALLTGVVVAPEMRAPRKDCEPDRF
jgi:hypothetical protein